jgi:hypothetical protein
MACFVAPATVAVVTTIVRKVVEKREGTDAAQHTAHSSAKVSGKWTQRLGWLNTMLWGGALLLALEHVWHGELVPWPPFLTAMQSPDQVGPMLHEIATYGTAMTAAVLVVWGLMVALDEVRSKASRRTTEAKAAGRGA